MRCQKLPSQIIIVGSRHTVRGVHQSELPNSNTRNALIGFELLWSSRFKRPLKRFLGIQFNNAFAIAVQFASARWFNYHRLMLPFPEHCRDVFDVPPLRPRIPVPFC
jgi:hypothetical protein